MTFGGWERAEGGLIVEFGPERFEDAMDEGTAIARVEAGVARGELGRPEAVLGEGAEPAGGLVFEHALAAAEGGIGQGGQLGSFGDVEVGCRGWIGER